MKKVGLLDSSALRSCLFVALIGTASPAFAQAAPSGTQTSADQTLPADAPADKPNDVVVVGSHIRSTYNTPDEVQIITPQEATLQGFNSPAETLQSTSVTGGAAQTMPVNGRIPVESRPDLVQSNHNGLFASGTLGRYSKVLNSVLESRLGQ